MTDDSGVRGSSPAGPEQQISKQLYPVSASGWRGSFGTDTRLATGYMMHPAGGAAGVGRAIKTLC